MFLRSIEITNLRSIASLKLDFGAAGETTRKWTLLLGENGCGKSSVLRAIGLVLAGSDALPELLGAPGSWVRNGATTCRVDAMLQTAEGSRRTIGVSIKRTDTIRTFFSRNAKSLSLLDRAIKHADRNYFVLGYGVSRRPPPSRARSSIVEERSRSMRAQGLGTLFSPESSLVSLEEWAMDLEYTRGVTALRTVRSALDGLLPDMKFGRIDKKSKRLLFETIDGNVPLSQLSDGYQNMAAWCGDLLYRITGTFPDRKDPLHTRGVLLIDELDLHLHPKWRRLLVDFLSRTLPNFQIIATTHSALTAQQCGEGELYVIRREGKRSTPTLVPFVGEPKKLMLHQLLLSPMFGLQSLDSVEVEVARREAGSLSGKAPKALTQAQKIRLRGLREQLKDAPDWSAVPDYEIEQTKLLKEVRAELAGNNSRVLVSPKKLKARVRTVTGRR